MGVASHKPISQPCPHCGKLLVQDRKGWAKCIACQYKVKLSGLETEEQKEGVVS